MQKKEKKQNSLQNGVYVRGFKKESDVEVNLRRLFTKYGPIKDIYVDKEMVRNTTLHGIRLNAVYLDRCLGKSQQAEGGTSPFYNHQ